MADAVATATITDTWFDGKRQWVVGTLAIGASPLNYVAGGITLSFAVNNMPGTKLSAAPSWVEIDGAAGFQYEYAAGTTRDNGKLQVFAETTVATNQPLLEYTVTAISAALSGDTPRFLAIFKVR